MKYREERALNNNFNIYLLMTQMGCLPREQFVPKDYLNQLTCTVGLGIFNDPVALPCQHVFCRSCIEAWLVKNNTCPKCRLGFTKESLKPQWIFARIIKNAPVYCSNTGCKWAGTQENLESHLALDCGEVVCVCTMGCGNKVKRSEMKTHLESCELRFVECKYCKVSITLKNSVSHEKSCYKNLVPCPKDCGKTLVASQVESHLKEECENCDIRCRFAKIAGCEYTGSKERLAEHYKTEQEKHIFMLADTIFKLQDRIDVMEKWGREFSSFGVLSPKHDAGGTDLVWSNGEKRVYGSAKGSWSFFLTQTPIEHNFKANIKVVDINQADTNGWKACIGIFNTNKYQAGSWGKYKNGWGYIMGNGNKVSTEAVPYGHAYGIGDTITIEYRNESIFFYRNNVPQGLAYPDMHGPFYLAVALSDTGHAVEIQGVTSTPQ